jgi:hypothetical protein
MTNEMELVVDAGGSLRCIYDEALDLREIAKLQITRASHVEPDRDGATGGRTWGLLMGRCWGLMAAGRRRWGPRGSGCRHAECDDRHLATPSCLSGPPCPTNSRRDDAAKTRSRLAIASEMSSAK